MIGEEQHQLLQRCFELARGHEFYREHLKNAADYRDAPCSDKNTLLPYLNEFDLHAQPRGIYLVRSGGSSQTPLIFPVDIAENNAQRHALVQGMCAMGMLTPRSVALNLFGYADLYRTAAIMDDLIERCDATTLPLSAHASYADMHAAAKRFSPTHVLGTPSKLQLLADYLRENNARLTIPNLIYGGECLSVQVRQIFAERLGVQQYWSLYGAAETGIWGWSNASEAPGIFHILPNVAVEIIAPDEQGFGELAVTNGYRTRFPVFRYLIGDVGRLIDRDGQRRLELRGRNARSFILAEEHFELNRFEPVVSGADAYQLQLHSSAQGRDRLALLLVSSDQQSCAEQRLSILSRCIGSIAPYIELSVQWVTMAELHHDPVTTKAPAIADFRR